MLLTAPLAPVKIRHRMAGRPHRAHRPPIELILLAMLDWDRAGEPFPITQAQLRARVPDVTAIGYHVKKAKGLGLIETRPSVGHVLTAAGRALALTLAP